MEHKAPKPYHPRWRYHKTKPAVLVKSAAHEKFLGEGWEDSPAKHGIITHPHSEEYLAMQAGASMEEFPEEDVVDEEEHSMSAEPSAAVPRPRGRPKKIQE